VVETFEDRFRPDAAIFRNLMTALGGRGKRVQTCHYAMAVGHLANISYLAGRSIRWDGENHKVLGDAAAQKLVTRPYRAPWKLAGLNATVRVAIFV
jgi:hypothetical protein